jgi:hypothetical protein
MFMFVRRSPSLGELVDAWGRCAARRAAAIHAELAIAQVVDEHEQDIRLLCVLRLGQRGSRVGGFGAAEQPCGERTGTGRLEKLSPAQHQDLLEHHFQPDGWHDGGIHRRTVRAKNL